MKFMILSISYQDLMKKIKCSIFILFVRGGGERDKRDRIKWDTIIGKVKEGGVSQVDIELKPKAMKAL